VAGEHNELDCTLPEHYAVQKVKREQAPQLGALALATKLLFLFSVAMKENKSYVFC